MWVRASSGNTMEKNCPRPLITLALAMVVVSAPLVHAQSTGLRNSLMMRLDSLEMAKQELRRQGLPLDELEALSSVVKDSLDAARDILPLVPPSVSTGGLGSQITYWRGVISTEYKQLFVREHRDLFDWIITVFVAAAVVATLILVLVLFRAAIRGVTRGRSHRKKPKKAAPPAVPFRAAPPSTTGYGSNAMPLRMAPAPKQEESLEQLRSRISTTELARQESRPEPPPRLDRTRDIAGQTPAKFSMKSQVIAAARQGLSVPEIARKLHVSTDQVSLVLKVARKKADNNSSREHP